MMGRVNGFAEEGCLMCNHSLFYCCIVNSKSYLNSPIKVCPPQSHSLVFETGSSRISKQEGKECSAWRNREHRGESRQGKDRGSIKGAI